MKANYKELNFFLFRAVMGINMFLHGGVRLFRDYKVFITKMEAMFEPTLIPGILVTIRAHLISPLEFTFGLFLLFGFKTKESLLILTMNMLLLVSGVCLLQKWDLAGLQMSYVLYLFFIGTYIELNTISLDTILENKRNRKSLNL